jgi:cbb3-type cytochrome oxidase subunit 3
MNWLLYPIRDFLKWLFENTLEPLGNTPNTIFFFVFLSGGIYWMFVQNKLNKKSENDADQIK